MSFKTNVRNDAYPTSVGSVGDKFIPAVAKSLTNKKTVGVGLAGLGAFYLLNKAKKSIQNKAAQMYDKYKL